MRPLGYAAVLGAAAEGSERRLAVLHRVGLELTSVDLEPGYEQAVSTGSTSFVHVHLAAGVFGSHDRERSVEAVLAPFLASCAVLPILVGDFNCVTDPVDTGANYRSKRCRPLADLVAAFNFVDAYPLLHPLPAFTFRRRGMAGSRLDRAYLPGRLVGWLESVEHVAAVSDHAALYVQLQGGLGAVVPPQPRRESYWKLNVALLQEPDFLPEFTSMWTRLVAARPPGAAPGPWWEEVAKPASHKFCITFSRMVAHRRRETTYLLQAGLQQALEAEDWPSVVVLRGRLAEEDRYRLRGRQVRSRQQTVAAEEDTIFHVAAERTASVGLTRLASTGPGGQKEVLEALEDIKEEVINYFGALFAGRHISTTERPEPFDRGPPGGGAERHAGGGGVDSVPAPGGRPPVTQGGRCPLGLTVEANHAAQL